MPAPDPRDKVTITSVNKRGDHNTVEGYVDGRKTTVHIPEGSMQQFKSDRDKEAYMRRSLLGTRNMEDRRS